MAEEATSVETTVREISRKTNNTSQSKARLQWSALFSFFSSQVISLDRYLTATGAIILETGFRVRVLFQSNSLFIGLT